MDLANQVEVDEVTSQLWPGETIEEAGLALAEEAGEVAKAIIKRNHARRSEGDRQGVEATVEHWSENLKTELAQVVIVAMKIANREGFDLWDRIEGEIGNLSSRRRRVEGQTLAEDLIAVWHQGAHTEQQVYETLKLTHDEYVDWMESSPPKLPDDFLARHGLG